jgi:hypothetical protein
VSPSVAPATEVATPASQEPAMSSPATNATVRFEAARQKASTQVNALGDGLGRGMQYTKDTAATYKAKPQSESIWLSLAKLAVMAGMTPIAWSIGMFLSSRLGDMVASRLLGVEAIADPDTVKAASKILERPLRKVGEGAFDRLMKEKASEATATEASARFFKGQQAGIDGFVQATQDALTDQWAALTPVLQDNPELAVDVMEAFRAAFAAHASVAETAQTSATAQAWVTFKARDSLGSETLQGAEGPTQVTKLASVRDFTHRGLGVPGDASGLLDIHVTLQEGVPHVDSATLNGVAQPVADVLLDSNLRAANMPFRIIVGRQGAIITVDEVGRARLSGALVLFTEDGIPTGDESQAHRGAQRVVDKVVAKSLRSWGLQHVATDDANA